MYNSLAAHAKVKPDGGRLLNSSAACRERRTAPAFHVSYGYLQDKSSGFEQRLQWRERGTLLAELGAVLRGAYDLAVCGVGEPAQARGPGQCYCRIGEMVSRPLRGLPNAGGRAGSP